MPIHNINKLSRRRLIEKLDEFGQMICNILPDVIHCPHCENHTAHQTIMTLDNLDVFVVCYACLSCTLMSVLEVHKAHDSKQRITVCLPDVDQLEIIISTYSRLPEFKEFVDLCKGQRDAMKKDNRSNNAWMN